MTFDHVSVRWRGVNFAGPRALACGVAMIASLLAAPVEAQTGLGTDGASAPSGPVRLRQPTQPTGNDTGADLTGGQRALPAQHAGVRVTPAAPPGEFESYVRSQPGGDGVTRFGSELIVGLSAGVDGNDYNPLVPPDYLLRSGDELVLTVWGSVDADLRLTVDRSGRINIPRVGPVMVSGVRYADLPEVVSKRVGQVFKNFQLSVSLGQLRGIRVYVTGFVSRPGSVMVNSLSTLAQALMKAGGPSAAGSFRRIELRRGGATSVSFDLYDLLLRGDRSADQRLEADDVIYVGPVGPQVALLGSVNRPSIFELKPNERIDDVLSMAGGFSAVADSRRLALERFEDRGAERVVQLSLPQNGRQSLNSGDLLRAFNLSEVVQPVGNQNKRVRIEGEVKRPGEYVLPPASAISDALNAAGGLTSNAYLYATEFTRESVRLLQQRNYERALRDFETQLATSATRRSTTAEEASISAASTAANTRVLEQLRSLKPTGRIVLQTTASTTTLPDLALEDGDRLYIPRRPNTVGVFGSVFSAGSYLHDATRTVGDYLRLAGGPTKGADEGSIFVVRANGTVSSSVQDAGFFRRGNQVAELRAEPGDTVFVPEEFNKSTWIQSAKDWTQILYQFGIGIAGIKSAVK